MYAGLVKFPNSYRTENIIVTENSQTLFFGLNYNPASLAVFHNGEKLVPGSGYTATDGNNLTLAIAAQPGDKLDLVSNDDVTDNVVSSVAGKSGAVELIVQDISGAAPINSPVFTGNPTSVTPPEGDNDTSIATSAFVQTELTHYPRLDLTGTVPVSMLPPAVLGSMIYQGVWDASTNIPTLISSSGTKGHYYKVSANGTTNLDGLSQWYIGDVAVFNGTTWDRLDGTPGEVISVSGKTGVIQLDVADVTNAAPVDGVGTFGTWPITAEYVSALPQQQVITGKTNSLSVVAGNSTVNGSFICRATGTGDGNLAGLSFYNDAYAIKLGVRNDGYFGLGGWSRTAWSWYSDPSGNMVAAGNVTAYSDPRLKENFEIVSDPMSILNHLDGGTFNWKTGIKHTEVKAGKRDYGILANQVEEVMPEIVTESISIDGDSYKTVAYEKLIPVLIEAIKELSREVEELKRVK